MIATVPPPARPRLAAEDEQVLSMARHTFPVKLPDGESYPVVSYRYACGGGEDAPQQVLLHGATYDHRYWDLPGTQGVDHSYARYMARQGYEVWALDLLGAGESGIPPGDLLTLDALVRSVHQVLSRIRTGAPLALVGHSLGSAVAVAVKASFPEAVDAVVTTGMGHVEHALPLSPDAVETWASAEYFRFPPEVRAGIFYAEGAAEPDAVAHDLATFRGAISRGELFTVMLSGFDPERTHIEEVTGPVRVQLGERDALYPAAYADGEAALWPNAEVSVRRLPHVGHAVNGHRGCHESWADIDAWLSRVLRP